MKRLVLMCGILASVASVGIVVSVGMGAMSQEEWDRNYADCIEEVSNENTSSYTSFEKLGGGLYQVEYYSNANKCFKIGCEKVKADQATSCHKLGISYYVRLDYHMAYEPFKKACDMKYGLSCTAMGSMYENGKGVRQNLSTAKQYFGKACDLGDQTGCDNYKTLNEQGMQ